MATELRTSHFRIHAEADKALIRDHILTTLHLQNILIILVDRNYQEFKEGKAPNLRDNLLHSEIMRDLIAGRSGGKKAAEVELLREHYKDNELFKALLETGKTLKEKNIYKLITKLKAAYKGYFSKIKAGDTRARPPRPEKLSRVTDFAMPIDGDAFSFAQENAIKINFCKKMEPIHFSRESLLKLVGSLEMVQAIELVLKHEDIYIAVTYHKEICAPERVQDTKFAGLDLGLKNIASLFVNDEVTSSLVIKGGKLSYFNYQSNKEIDALKSEIDLEKARLSDLEEIADHEYAQLNAMKSELGGLFITRHHKFKDGFSKLARRVLEYLSAASVSDLCVSRNLGARKQEPGLSKKFNKKFYPIPLLKLLDYLSLNAGEYGIVVHEIDEAYTSKCSSMSGDIKEAQEICPNVGKNSPERANVLNGRRVRRSEYFDQASGHTILADLNGAFNHLLLKTGRVQGNILWKLTRPLVFHFDSLLLDLSRVGVPKLRDPQRVSCAAKLLNVQVCTGL